MRRGLLGFAALLFSISAYATLVIPMIDVDTGENLGTVKADDTVYGLLLTPHLKNIMPGIHGFHIHEFPSCDCHGMAAGGHFDPERNDQHRGPYNGDGHLGDLGVLIVNGDGKATLPVLAPRLKLADIKDRALVIHRFGDNYSDTPRVNGGGGPMYACGVIPYF